MYHFLGPKYLGYHIKRTVPTRYLDIFSEVRAWYVQHPCATIGNGYLVSNPPIMHTHEHDLSALAMPCEIYQVPSTEYVLRVGISRKSLILQSLSIRAENSRGWCIDVPSLFPLNSIPLSVGGVPYLSAVYSVPEDFIMEYEEWGTCLTSGVLRTPYEVLRICCYRTSYHEHRIQTF